MDLLKQYFEEKTKEIETSINLALKDKLTEVNKLLEELKNNVKLPVIQFKTDTGTKTELKHKSFNTLAKVILSTKRTQKNILLVGEAGAGKSKLVEQVANYAGLDFYPMSIGNQTTKSDLMGYVNINGEYVTTPVRQAFENGGVLLLDEIDCGNANTLTILNNLLSNNIICFPDGKATKSNKFIVICTANTYGKGATFDYVGRNKLDGATLDRFIVIEVEYDETIEKTICDNSNYYDVIKHLRENAKNYDLKFIISPRAVFNGADLLDGGFTLKEVLEMVVFKGASDDIKNKLLEGITLPEEVA